MQSLGSLDMLHFPEAISGMLLPHLAKLLLQSDSHPVVEELQAQFLLAAQEERVKCCLRPSGDALAVAVGQRLVTVRWRDPAGAPDLADLGFVSAVEAPEEVTAVAWPSRGGQPADECIVVGTSTGWVQLHAPGDGRLLHRQELHGSAVQSIDVRWGGAGVDPGDLSEDVTVAFSDAVVRLQSWDILAVARWHGGGNGVGAGWWAGAAAPPQLTPAKWALPRGVGPRSHALCLGSPPPELYTLLTGRKQLRKLQILTAGANPPLATFEAVEGSGPGLLSLVSDLASATAAGLLGRAKAVAGAAGPEARGAAAAGTAPGRAAKIRADPVTLSASLWDEKRGVTSVSMSPCGAWAACCDSLGRILLVEAAATLAVLLLKGYREAQVGWLVLAPPAAAATGTAVAGTAGAVERYLVVYAPRRGVLELWHPRAGACVGRMRYQSKYGVLLQQQPAAGGAGPGAGGGGAQPRLSRCWVLNAETAELLDLTDRLAALLPRPEPS